MDQDSGGGGQHKGVHHHHQHGQDHDERDHFGFSHYKPTLPSPLKTVHDDMTGGEFRPILHDVPDTISAGHAEMKPSAAFIKEPMQITGNSTLYGGTADSHAPTSNLTLGGGAALTGGASSHALPEYASLAGAASIPMPATPIPMPATPIPSAYTLAPTQHEAGAVTLADGTKIVFTDLHHGH